MNILRHPGDTVSSFNLQKCVLFTGLESSLVVASQAAATSELITTSFFLEMDTNRSTPLVRVLY